MKINCGPTWSEKRAAKQKWHLAFAWFPIRTGSRDCRWLEHYWRRLEYQSPFGDVWEVCAFEKMPSDPKPEENPHVI